MSFEIEGKLIEKYSVQQVTDSFRKREFVIEKSEESFGGRTFTETIKFQLIQDRCDELEKYNINDDIKVTFNIKGRKWEKDGKVSYFNNLEAWKLEGASATAEDHGYQSDAPPPSEADFIVSDDENDDLPF